MEKDISRSKLTVLGAMDGTAPTYVTQDMDPSGERVRCKYIPITGAYVHIGYTAFPIFVFGKKNKSFLICTSKSGIGIDLFKYLGDFRFRFKARIQLVVLILFVHMPWLSLKDPTTKRS